jgi:hypothetical protein
MDAQARLHESKAAVYVRCADKKVTVRASALARTVGARLRPRGLEPFTSL